MPRISDQVRQLVGLENLLVKARRRHRESEREEGEGGEKTRRYRALIKRLSDELHATGREQLEEYLAYVEGDLLPRISKRVEATKETMVEAARRIVEARMHLAELRLEYSDALDRSRSLRERLGLELFRAPDLHWGVGVHAPHADRHEREAHDLVREYLKG